MANYTETFSGQTTGSNSTTHTNRYASETTISVENPAIDEQDDRVLRFNTGSDSGYQMQSMDSVDSDGNRDNCEVLCRFRVTTDDDNSAWLFARASGSATSETAYGLHVSSNGSVRIVRLNSATYTALDGIDADTYASPWTTFLGDTFNFIPPNEWLWGRLRVNGTGATVTVNGRVWVDGQEEPTDWTLSASDTSASRITAAGWCGFGRFVTTGVTYLDMMAVGTNGDTAVAATSTTPVRVTNAIAQVLHQNEATPVRVTNAHAHVLQGYNATPVRVTNVSAHVLYTVPAEAPTGQTIVAFIGTG